MVSIQFWVGDALPPKNSGIASMWNMPREAERLVRLRLPAAQAMNGSPPLTHNIRLRVMIFSSDQDPLSASELGDYIGGILSGLKRAPAEAQLDSFWRKPHFAHIHPTKAICIEDDAAVIGISLEKVLANRARPMYRVALEGARDQKDSSVTTVANIRRLSSRRDSRQQPRN